MQANWISRFISLLSDQKLRAPALTLPLATLYSLVARDTRDARVFIRDVLCRSKYIVAYVREEGCRRLEEVPNALEGLLLDWTKALKIISNLVEHAVIPYQDEVTLIARSRNPRDLVERYQEAIDNALEAIQKSVSPSAQIQVKQVERIIKNLEEYDKRYASLFRFAAFALSHAVYLDTLIVPMRFWVEKEKGTNYVTVESKLLDFAVRVYRGVDPTTLNLLVLNHAWAQRGVNVTYSKLYRPEIRTRAFLEIAGLLEVGGGFTPTRLGLLAAVDMLLYRSPIALLSYLHRLATSREGKSGSSPFDIITLALAFNTSSVTKVNEILTEIYDMSPDDLRYIYMYLDQVYGDMLGVRIERGIGGCPDGTGLRISRGEILCTILIEHSTLFEHLNIRHNVAEEAESEIRDYIESLLRLKQRSP